MPYRATQLDDRGIEVELLDWERLDRRAPHEAQLRDLIRLELADPVKSPRALGPRALGWFVKLILAGSVGLLLFGVLRWLGLWSPSIWMIAIVFGLAAPLLRLPLDRVVDSVLLRIIGGRHSRQLASMSLSQCLCAGCGYSLDGLEAEADECIVCPECGAAWKAGRIGRPDPTRPEPFQPS